MITNKQKEQIEAVCGENFEESDIPAFWRNEADENGYCGGMIEPIDEDKERKLVEQAEIQAEIEKNAIREVESANELKDKQVRFLHKVIRKN